MTDPASPTTPGTTQRRRADHPPHQGSRRARIHLQAGSRRRRRLRRIHPAGSRRRSGGRPAPRRGDLLSQAGAAEAVHAAVRGPADRRRDRLVPGAGGQQHVQPHRWLRDRPLAGDGAAARRGRDPPGQSDAPAAAPGGLNGNGRRCEPPADAVFWCCLLWPPRWRSSGRRTDRCSASCPAPPSLLPLSFFPCGVSHRRRHPDLIGILVLRGRRDHDGPGRGSPGLRRTWDRWRRRR